MRTVKKKKKPAAKEASPPDHQTFHMCSRTPVGKGVWTLHWPSLSKSWIARIGIVQLAWRSMTFFPPPILFDMFIIKKKIHPLQHTHTHKDVSFSLSVFVCLLPISLYYYYFFLITRSDLPGPYLCSRVALTATVRTVLQLHFLHVFEL